MDNDKRMGNDPLAWIGDTKEDELTQPVKKVYEKSSKEGLKDDYTRATFIVREDLLEKLKDYAWTERKTLKDTINEILEEYLKDKEIMERNDN